MKAKIARAELMRGLQHAQAILERRNTIPILSNVMLEAKGDGIIVTSTDLDIVFHETIDANIETAGSITVPGHLFFDIARKLNDDSTIGIETQDNRMIVTAGRARFSIPTLSADEYPTMIDEGGSEFTIPAKNLLSLLARPRFAMSTEDTRYYLNGIYLHTGPSSDGSKELLYAVATDGHRLRMTSTEKPEGMSADVPHIIIPRKAVNEICRLLDGAASEDIVTISITARKIRFQFGRIDFITKTVDGTFPDYTRVIPSDHKSTITTDAEVLRIAIDRVSIIALERTKAVKMEMNGEGIVLSVTSPDMGTATETASCTYEGNPLTIGFNSSYLQEILSQYGSEEIEIKFGDPSSPALIRKIGAVDDLSVIMPMRV